MKIEVIMFILGPKEPVWGPELWASVAPTVI